MLYVESYDASAMHRRTFVRVLTAGGVALVIEPSLAGCQSGPPSAELAWKGPSPALADEDVRLRIVSYGLLAPSIANLQPWWVSLKHPGILVALEPQRVLPLADADLHQTFVSQGAFIESMRLAAGEFGFRTTVTPLPAGEPAAENNFGLPVARLDLLDDGSPDVLARQLTRRRTNRKPFRKESVPSADLQVVTGAIPAGAKLHWFSDPDTRRSIIDAVLDATASSLDQPERYQETVGTLRWSKEETDRKRDGVPLSHLGLSPWSEWYERILRSRTDIDGGGLKERLLDMARRQATTAPTFGVITTPESGRTAELVAGAALLRAHLAATSLGLALQPLNAPLEGRMTLPDGLLPGGEVPHVLFRIGYADDIPPTPRRTLFEVVQL